MKNLHQNYQTFQIYDTHPQSFKLPPRLFTCQQKWRYTFRYVGKNSPHKISRAELRCLSYTYQTGRRTAVIRDCHILVYVVKLERQLPLKISVSDIRWRKFAPNSLLTVATLTLLQVNNYEAEIWGVTLCRMSLKSVNLLNGYSLGTATRALYHATDSPPAVSSAEDDSPTNVSETALSPS